jgi:hypothetical protein
MFDQPIPGRGSSRKAALACAAPQSHARAPIAAPAVSGQALRPNANPEPSGESGDGIYGWRRVCLVEAPPGPPLREGVGYPGAGGKTEPSCGCGRSPIRHWPCDCGTETGFFVQNFCGKLGKIAVFVHSRHEINWRIICRPVARMGGRLAGLRDRPRSL